MIYHTETKTENCEEIYDVHVLTVVVFFLNKG